MPRVPVQTTPSVSLRPIGAPQEHLNPQGTSLEAGLADGANALAKAADHYQQVFQKEKDQADATAAMAAEVELESFIDSEHTRIASLQGENALRESVGVMARVEAKRDEVNKKLRNLPQREAFDRRAMGVLASAASRVDRTVVGLQQKHTEQTFDALMKGKLEKARHAVDEADFEGALASIDAPLRVEAQRRGLSTTKAGGEKSAAETFVEEGKAAAVKGRLDSLIDTGDAEGARKTLDRYGSTLGEKAKGYRGVIDKLMLDVDVQKGATSILDSARYKAEVGLDGEPKGVENVDPDAINPALARWRVEQLPAGTPAEAERKARTAAEVERRIAQHRSSLDATASRKLQEAEALYAKTGRTSGGAFEKLDAWMMEPRNGHADDWVRWKAQKARAARIKAKGPSAAEDRRRQAVANKLAMELHKQNELNDYAGSAKIDVDSAYADADDVTREQIRTRQAKANKVTSEGGLVRRERFLGDVGRELRDLKTSKEETADLVADLADWYDEFQEKEKREPTRVEVDRQLGMFLLRGDGDGSSLINWGDGSTTFYGVAKRKGQRFVPFKAEEQDSPRARDFVTRNPQMLLGQPEQPVPEKPKPPVRTTGKSSGEQPFSPVSTTTTLRPPKGSAADKAQIVARIRAANPAWTPQQVNAELQRQLAKYGD